MARRSKGAWLQIASLAAVAAVTALAATASAAVPAPRPHRLAGRAPGKPAYLWLWYADGKALPQYAQYCGDLAPPPAYQCNFGSSLQDCQRQVQAYLDAWYKDFNLVFTLTRPASEDFYVIVITSGWPQCAARAAQLTGAIASNEGGIAPGDCLDSPSQTAFAIQCGSNAHDCATIIAHEHGHLVGLVHTTSTLDVMNASVQSTAAGFLDQPSATVADLSNMCGVDQQISYQKMLAALGPWSGGAKPVLFASPDAGIADARAADAQDGPVSASVDGPVADASSVGSVIGSQGPSIDGSMTILPGFDAYERTAPTIPDAGSALMPALPSGKAGCEVVPTRAPAPLFILALAALPLAYLLGRKVLPRSAPRARRPSRRP